MNTLEKNVITLMEAAKFTGLSTHTIYRLTSEKKIPHYKPNNGRCFFKKDELEAWLTQNKIEVQSK